MGKFLQSVLITAVSLLVMILTISLSGRGFVAFENQGLFTAAGAVEGYSGDHSSEAGDSGEHSYHQGDDDHGQAAGDEHGSDHSDSHSGGGCEHGGGHSDDDEHGQGHGHGTDDDSSFQTQTPMVQQY